MARSTDFSALAARKGYIGRVFKIVGKRAGTGYVADAERKPISHTKDEIAHIREILYAERQRNLVADGIEPTSPDDMLREMTRPSSFRGFFTAGPRDAAGAVRARVLDASGKPVDSFMNPMTGVGTWDDPGMYNTAQTPVIMSPMEASAYYANGGLPQIIIDKKAKGILLDGYGFEGEGWAPDECKRLVEYAELLGTSEAIVDGAKDGLIHGGAFLYPVLKGDTTFTTPMSFEELLKARVLGKDCISHWAEADRWNTVLVPNWDVTARDYIYPKTIYVPIGGVEVATARAAVIRPRKLDYWGMIRQIGWTTSEFEGWIRPLTGYVIVIAAVPIMAQQMSLLVHEIPMDGIIAQDGVTAAQQFIEQNVQTMRSWSMVNPVTVNSFGTLKAIERHYEGFRDIIEVFRQHVAASCGIPESVLFHTQPKGFSDNADDLLLKQSETITLFQEAIRPQLSPLARMLAVSCFGPDQAILAKLHTLRFTFKPPIVETSSQKAESGGKFADLIQKLSAAQVPLDVAFETAKLFFPGLEIPKSIMEKIEQIGESDPRVVEQGMEKLKLTYGADIVRRLSQRMGERQNPRGLIVGAVAKRIAGNGKAEETPEDVKQAVAAKLAQDSAAERAVLLAKVGELETRLRVSQRTILTRVGGMIRRVLAGVSAAVRDKAPSPPPNFHVEPHINVAAPPASKVEVGPTTVQAPPAAAPPEVTIHNPITVQPARVEMPPIKIDVHVPAAEPRGSVTTFTYDVDENGMPKPGTIKATRVPTNGGKK